MIENGSQKGCESARVPAPGSEQRSEENFQTRSVVIISAAHATHDSYTGFLPALLPVLMDTIQITTSQAGILSIFLRIPSLLQPLIGYLADRLNLRMLIVVTPLLTAVVMSLIGVTPFYSLIILLLLLAGTSSAGFHSVAPVVAGYLSGKSLGRGMSFMMVGGELGRLLGPLILVSFLSIFETRHMPLLILYGLTASLLLFFLLRDLPEHRKPVSKSSQSIGKIIRHMRPILVPLTFYLLLRAFIFSAMTTYLPIFLTQSGATLFLAGASLTIFEAGGILGAFIGGSLSDNLGRRKVLLFSVLTTPALVLLFLNSPQWLRVILLVLIGFVILSVTPVLMALVQESYPDNRSLANGSFMTISFLTNAFGLAAVGFSGDQFGLQVTYTVSALLLFLAVPFVLLFPENQSKSV